MNAALRIGLTAILTSLLALCVINLARGPETIHIPTTERPSYAP